MGRALICLFLPGRCSNYTIQISKGVPFPSAPSGITGLIPSTRHAGRCCFSPYRRCAARAGQPQRERPGAVAFSVLRDVANLRACPGKGGESATVVNPQPTRENVE